MKLDSERIVVMRDVMKALANGIDPTSNIAFPDDTILNSKLLQSCFMDAFKTFSFIENNIDAINDLPLKRAKKLKIPFFIQEDELSDIPISETPLPISKFVFIINSVCNSGAMAKLKAIQLTSWLVSNGYLEVLEVENGNTCKSATEKGARVGITSEKRINSKGEEYIVNLYDRNAQQFILTGVIPKLNG